MSIAEAISGVIQTVSNGVTGVLRATNQQSLSVGQVEPPKYEMTLSGKRFALGVSAAITGIAPVTAYPTTAAQFALYNTSATKKLYIERIGAILESGTPGVGGSMLACIFTVPVTTGVLYTGFKILDLSGGSNSSAGVVQAAVTISAPAAPAWIPVAHNNNANVGAFPGSGNMSRGDQGIVLPPGSALGLAYLGLAGTTPLFVPELEWCEIG